jgi:hypothetical protein
MSRNREHADSNMQAAIRDILKAAPDNVCATQCREDNHVDWEPHIDRPAILHTPRTQSIHLQLRLVAMQQGESLAERVPAV